MNSQERIKKVKSINNLILGFNNSLEQVGNSDKKIYSLFDLTSQDKERLKYIYTLFSDLVKLIQEEEKNNFSNNNNNEFNTQLNKIISQYKEYQVDALYKTIDHKYKQNIAFKALLVDKVNDINKLLIKASNFETKIKQALSLVNLPSNLDSQLKKIISEVKLRKLFDLQFETLTDCLNKLILNTEIQRRKK